MLAKRLFLLSALVGSSGLLNSTASAEGMPSLKDTPVAVEQPAWTGPYIGINVGYGHNSSKNNYVDTVPSSSSVSESANGGFVSFKLGYDRQISSRFVLGVFVDFDQSDIDRGDHSIQNALTIDRSWAVGGRLGYLVRPNIMLFATGGFTQAHFNNDGWWDILANGVGPNLPGRSAVDFNGYFIGGGIEGRLNANVYLTGEIRYAEFSQRTTNSGNYLGTTYVDKEDPNLLTARVGIAYKFNRNAADAPNESENPKLVTYGGVDVAKHFHSFYSGTLMALNGDLGHDGFVVRTEGYYASYKFNDETMPGQNIKATDRALDVMLGYQHYFGSTSAILLLGYEVRDVALSPNVLNSNLRGTQSGFKVATELETEDEVGPFYANLDASYSTGYDTFYSQLQVGYNSGKFIFGPEGSIYKDSGGKEERIGAFLKLPINFLPHISGKLTFDGGYQFVDKSQAQARGAEGAYVGSMLKFVY